MKSKLKGEEVYKKLKPHPLSFSKIYLTFLYVSVIGVIHILYSEQMISFFANLPVLSIFSQHAPILIWWLMLVIPGIIVALLRISWKWLALFIGIALSLTSLSYLMEISYFEMNLALVGIGVFGIVFSDLYRLSHKFSITNYRIITEVGFIKTEKRTLLYNKINDLVIQKPLLGKFLNFGTIIPVTGSGFGLGEDFSVAGAGVGAGVEEKGTGVGGLLGFGGGKTIQNPRAKSPYVLFGVNSPNKVHDKIVEFMHDKEESHYLEKISEDIDDLVNEEGIDSEDEGTSNY